MLLAGDEPDKKTYKTISLIIYSIWQARKYMELSTDKSGLHMLLTIYAGLTHSTGKLARKKAIKDVKRKEKIKISKLLVKSLLEVANPDDIFIYTDGSALGNPGPTGAGVVVFRNSKLVFRSAVGVGDGDNNLGEVVALGLALRYCLINYNNQVIHLFSDSEYAISIARGKNYKNFPRIGKNLGKVLTNVSLINAVQLHWVAAHADIDGNEAADEAAKQGANRAFTGDSLPLHHLSFDSNPLGVQLLATARNIPKNPHPCYCSVCMGLAISRSHQSLTIPPRKK
jgi:ribonuclease HI